MLDFLKNKNDTEVDSPQIDRVIPERKKPNSEQLKDMERQAESAQTEFLKQALEKGISGDELNKLIADAMSKKIIPRILTRSSGTRNGSYIVDLLDGEIPASALVVSTSTGSSGEFTGRITLAKDPFSAEATSENDDYSVKSTRVSATVGTSNAIDNELLAQVSDHIEVNNPSKDTK